MYRVTVRLSAQSTTVASSISSSLESRRIAPTPSARPELRYASAAMAEPSIRDIDALVGPATPHFAYQLRARVRELIEDLPADHPVRRYGEEKMRLLDDLGHASSKAEGGEKESRERLGWEQIPSSAPAYEPLPPRS